MPSTERQQDINVKSSRNPSRLSAIIKSKPFLYSTSVGIMGGVAGASILAGGSKANAESHIPTLVNENSSHIQQIGNINLSNQLEVNGVNFEVKGLPQVRTARESDVSSDYLAAKLGEEISFIVPAGSNVNDQIHEQVKNKTGADLNGADTWQVVVEVGGSQDNLVYPGQVKTYKVNKDAIATIQNANVVIETESAPKIEPANAPQSAAIAPQSVQEVLLTADQATDCIPTDLKGSFAYSGDHLASDPSHLDLQNVQPSERQACPDNVWIRTYGSNQTPNSSGWLQSQEPVISQIAVHNTDGSITQTSSAEGMVTIPNNTNDLNVDVDLPNGDFCWYQEEAVRTSDLRNPPEYFGNDMIDYAFVADPDRDPQTCLPKATATPTNTVTSTITSTPTSTETRVPTKTATASPTAVPATSTSTKEPSSTTTSTMEPKATRTAQRTATVIATKSPEPTKSTSTVEPTLTNTPVPTETSTTIPATSTQEATKTSTSIPPTSTSTTEACIPTDLKGNIVNFTKDTSDDPHMSDNPVLFDFENVSKNSNCPNIVYVDTFASKQKEPNGPGWLESQHYVEGSQKEFLVPAGTTREEWVSFPKDDIEDCTFQMDAVRTSEIRIPPRYAGNDMIDYGFEKNKACEPTPTPTATSTSTETATATATATNPPEIRQNTATPTSSPTKTPEATASNTPTETPPPPKGPIIAPNTGFGPDNSNKGKSNLPLLAGMGFAALAMAEVARRARNRMFSTESKNIYEQRLYSLISNNEDEDEENNTKRTKKGSK